MKINLTGLTKINARGTKEEEERKFQAVMRRNNVKILEAMVGRKKRREIMRNLGVRQWK